MGMFGSIGRALGNFNEADPKTGVSWADRIAAASGALAGDPGAYSDFAKLKMQRQQQAQQQEILKELTGAMGPQYATTPDIDVRPRGMIGGSYLPTSALPRGGVPADAGNSYAPTPGELNLPTSAPADAAPEAAPYQFQMPQRTSDGLSIDDPRLPGMVLRAQQAGVKMDPILEILKARQPDVQVGPDGTTYNKRDPSALRRTFANRSAVNGSIVDLNNPSNEGRFFGDAPVKGAMPVKDARGNIVDWTIPEGALGAIAGSAFANSRGNAKGTAPYDFVNVPGPKGAPRVISKEAAAGGDFVGAAPADVTYDNSGATAAQGRMQGYVTAGQTAGKTLSTLNRLRELDQGIGGGKLAPLGADVASYASSLGIKLDPKLPNKEAIAALTNKLVVDGLGGSLGPGVSNSDVAFFQKMQPSLANTPQGRKMMVDYGIALASRNQRVTTMAQQWEQRYGRIDARNPNGQTFEQNLARWADQNPITGRR